MEGYYWQLKAFSYSESMKHPLTCRLAPAEREGTGMLTCSGMQELMHQLMRIVLQDEIRSDKAGSSRHLWGQRGIQDSSYKNIILSPPPHVLLYSVPPFPSLMECQVECGTVLENHAIL